MEPENRLSNQGLKAVEADLVEDLKLFFKDEILSTTTLTRKGYFIGKTLLGKMLLENEEAAGIMISFGLSQTLAEGGQLQLIIEPASGIEADDEPNIISYLQKYATTKSLGTGGPDGSLPMIKPKPPTA
jgi:hypothetical protein